MEDEIARLTQLNYTAYREKAGGRSLVTGDPLPSFGALSPEVREAWEAGTLAVVNDYASRRTES